MITYKKLDAQYAQRAKDFCDKANLDFPVTAEIIFIATNEQDEIVGLSALKKVYQLEPLISNSPIVAMVLAEKAMSLVALANIPEVMAIVNDNKTEFIVQLERYGFIVTDKHMTVLVKEV